MKVQQLPLLQETQFLRTYLKAKYIADDSNIYGVTGFDSTQFAGLGIGFGIQSNGSPYLEDYPDVIDTTGGSTPILKYNSVSKAAIAFTGSFNNSPNVGQIIYLAFPFETINLADARTQVMTAALKYFGLIQPSDVQNEDFIPNDFSLNQNYPNPFNPSTKIAYEISQKGMVRLNVYDVLGREVDVLINDFQVPGRYEVIFSGNNLSSGIYFYKLETEAFSQVKKMILLK